MTRRSTRTRAPSPEPSASANTIPVVFLSRHTHAGVDYKKGEQASFSERVVEKLLPLGVIELEN